jgi:site-specific DNA recombinase
MDGYIRVSRVKGREGDGFISPTVQREQIQGWANLRGVEIAAWHEDLDQSGGKLNRPGLNAALARLEAGETEGIIVAKLDRLSRLGVGDALKLIERITSAGGSISAVDLGLDPTTPFGEFGMTIMLAMGRMERRRLADSWAIAQAKAIERGAKTSPTPYGYLRAEDGTLYPHPVESLHLQRAYELAAGQSASAAHRYLQQNAPGRYWTTTTVRRMLARRSYLGESKHGENLNTTAHDPLVTRKLWEAAQRPPRPRAPSDAYPLSGIARCATCGNPMVAGPHSSTGKRIYRCSGAQTLHRGERCVKPAAIVADRLEAHLRDQLAGISSLELDSSEGGEELALAERALTEAETELEAFAADLTMRRALGERYHENLALRANAAEQAREQYRRLARDSETLGLLTGADVLKDPAMMAALLGSMRLTINVRPGRGSVSDRVTLTPFDAQAPAGKQPSP